MLRSTVTNAVIDSLLGDTVEVKRNIFIIDDDLIPAYEIAPDLVSDRNPRRKCVQCGYQTVCLQLERKQALCELLALHYSGLCLCGDGSGDTDCVRTPRCGYFSL